MSDRAPSNDAPQLAEETAKAVRRIQFVTGKQVANVMAGAYLSVFKGQGMEFEEVRPYVPGDDVRAIDWNVTARTGEAYIKRFVEERELTVMLVVDVSASLEFGSGARSKREAAAELAALVALSATANDDKVGLLLFRDQPERFIPPRRGGKHALRVVRDVLAPPQHGPSAATGLASEAPRWRTFWRTLRGRTKASQPRGTNLTAALQHCGRVLPRRTVLFVISDFLDEDYLPALRLLQRRHDVICARIVDPREQHMPPSGLIAITDLESGQERLVDSSSRSFAKALGKAASRRTDRLAAEFREAGIDLLTIDTTASVVDPLLRLLRERERRRSR